MELKATSCSDILINLKGLVRYNFLMALRGFFFFIVNRMLTGFNTFVFLVVYLALSPATDKHPSNVWTIETYFILSFLQNIFRSCQQTTLSCMNMIDNKNAK